MLIQRDIQSEDIDSVLTLCNSLQLATICLSPDMHITRANSIAGLLFLHPEHQLINKSFCALCRELGIDAPITSSTTPQTLEHISAPTIHVLSKQKLVNVHWSISCFLEEETHTGYLLVGKITVNPQSHLQMESVLRSLPYGVFSKDISGNFLTVNKYLVTKSGFSSEMEMIGKNDYDASWLPEAEMLRQADKLALKDNTTIILEEVITLHGGKKEAFLTTKSPLTDEHGNVLGVVGTSTNITQQKHTLLLNEPATSLIQSNKYSSKIYLSKKEIECVNWMIKGKSSSEMATIFGISKRTVEAHMNNIKTKLNCYKQFQVGYLIGKYGYLFL